MSRMVSKVWWSRPFARHHCRLACAVAGPVPPPSRSQSRNRLTRRRWSLSRLPSRNFEESSIRLLSTSFCCTPTPVTKGDLPDSADASVQTSWGRPNRQPSTSSLPMPASTGSCAKCAPRGVSRSFAFSIRSCSSLSSDVAADESHASASSSCFRCSSTALSSTSCSSEERTAASVGGVRALARNLAGWPSPISETRRQSESRGTRSISGFSKSSMRFHLRTLTRW
mmetsp:Transcript_115378/g.309408  ORF Transcript_115378/g.309408 Transcript_115378/m.309408 type:complete len:226 (-) Transcript_115378:116-793(-)